MTKGRRTIVALLAVVAVLLGLNLIVNLSPQKAQAQPPWLPLVDDTPTVVDIEVEGGYVWRLWSDGLLETRHYTGDYFGSNARCWDSLFIGPNPWFTVEECLPL